MAEKFLALTRKYEELNTRALEARSKLLAIEKARSKHLAVTMTAMCEMHNFFKFKPVAYEPGGFATFEDYVTDWLRPVVGLERRQIFYYISVGKHLRGKVTDQELETLGIEKAKVLARVAESKGKVSKELVEQAHTLTVPALREKVQEIVYHGNPSHEGGNGDRWLTKEVRGPKQWIDDIEFYLRIARRQEGNKPSDAELIALVLKPVADEIVAAEEERRAQVRGVA